MDVFTEIFKKKNNLLNLLDQGDIEAILRDDNIIISPDIKRNVRIPLGQHEVNNWPVLHAGSVQKIDPGNWKLQIWGEVEEEVQLNYPEFRKVPQIEVFLDIHCVTGWFQLNNLWKGVSTSTLRDIISLKPEAAYALVHAPGGFTVNLPLKEFFAEDVLLATHHNKKPINPEHGGPVRLVVPQLYFWKSAKWITGIQFLKEDQRGFWESNGYHNHGDPWKEERYSWQEKS